MHGKLIEVLFLRLRPHTLSFKEKGKRYTTIHKHGKQRKNSSFLDSQLPQQKTAITFISHSSRPGYQILIKIKINKTNGQAVKQNFDPDKKFLFL